MEMTMPVLTQEAREAALAKARAARKRRADIKEDLNSGKISVGEVLELKEDPAIARLKVSDLLTSLPGIGDAKAKVLMQDSKIALNRRVGGVGANQAKRLVAAVDAFQAKRG